MHEIVAGILSYISRSPKYGPKSWWRHQMETFSTLLAICVGNSLVTGEFPAQRPVTQSFDVFFDLLLNERLSKQSWGWWFETLCHPQGCHGSLQLKIPDISLTIHWYCCNFPWRNPSVFQPNSSPMGLIKLLYFWHRTKWFNYHYPNIIIHNIHFLNFYCFHKIDQYFSLTNTRMGLCIPIFIMRHWQLANHIAFNKICEDKICDFKQFSWDDRYLC